MTQDILDIARETGLRSYLHGVNAQDARELLERFVAAANDAMREALENSNSLLVALLIESRSRAEIEQQIADNRAAIQAKEARSNG